MTDADWAKYELPTFQKEFYKQHPNIANLTDAQVEGIRKKLVICLVKYLCSMQSLICNMGYVISNTKELCKQHPNVGNPTYILQDIRVAANAPRPIMSFAEGSFPEYVLAQVKAEGFTDPTPVQAQSWPIAMSGTAHGSCVCVCIKWEHRLTRTNGQDWT